MAKWLITTQARWEAEWRQKLGDAEFERRLAIADAKADELDALKDPDIPDMVPGEAGRPGDDAAAAAAVLRPQFRSLAVQMLPETLEKAEQAPAARWAYVVSVFARRACDSRAAGDDAGGDA